MANPGKFHSGQSDPGLTESGKEDAMRAGAFLRGIPFDLIYSSDLSRALETCKLALPDCKPIKTELLREIDVGSLSGKYVADCIEQGE